ncbi:PilZ domain-containing protein [Sphingomonas qilianensis]
MMVLTATVYVDKGGALDGDNRQAERRAVQAGATLRDDNEAPIDAELIDLSTSGCQVALQGELVVPSMVTIGVAGIGRIDACVVRRDGDRYGCAFIEPLTAAAVAAARAVETVVPLSASALPTPAPAEQALPEQVRLSIRSRVLLIVGSAVTAWGAVIAAVLGVRALVS